MLCSNPIFSQRTSSRTTGLETPVPKFYGNPPTCGVCTDEDHAEIAKDRGSADVWAWRNSPQSDDELQTVYEAQSNLEQEVIDLKLKIETRCQGVSEGDAVAAAKKTSYMSILIKFVAENHEKGKLMQTLLPTDR